MDENIYQLRYLDTCLQLAELFAKDDWEKPC